MNAEAAHPIPLDGLLGGFALAGVGAALFPLVIVGLLSPVVAVLGVASVVISVRGAGRPPGRRPGAGMTFLVLAPLFAYAGSVAVVVAWQGASGGTGWSSDTLLVAAGSTAASVVSAHLGARLRFQRSSTWLVLGCLLTPPLAGALGALLTLAWPTAA